MKTRETKQPSESSRPDPPRQSIHVEFHDDQAQAVFIAGTFNDWRPDTTPMINLGQGRWVKDLRLAPGRYEYRFVADGQWRSDPKASESAPDGYGNSNSVLVVLGRTGTKSCRE